MANEWTNWSGSVRCQPARIVMPRDEEDVCAVVRDAVADGLTVRVAGTGHSFTPLVATDGVLVLLDRLSGLRERSRETHEATLWAGTRLSGAGGILHGIGLGMENLGDINVQALAGAISTGTHGTGHTLGNISSQVTGLRLVTASGELVEWTEEHDPDLLRAGRVSLGLLGVITAVRLRLMPAYQLREHTWREGIESCIERLPERIEANRHFEFFWYPQTDTCEMKAINPVEAEAPSPAPDARERTNWSHEILPSIREQKFNEMEYAVPAEAGEACFREVRDRFRERHPDVAWPVEYRTLAADDAWLSPAHGRATVTISIHQDARLPFREFFDDIEPIFRAHGGRPHWGKIHSATRDDLDALYPRWVEFVRLRGSLDPDGRFLNGYLRDLFG